jgi:hypothetical protein
MLDALLGVARDAGRRVTLIGLLPTAMLVLWILFLVWGGAPSDAPSVNRFVDHLADLSTTEVLLGFLALLGFAILSQPLQLPLVRLLEGYWPAAADRLANRRREAHRKRRAKLEAAQMTTGDERDGDEPGRADDGVDRGRAAWRLRKLYPPDRLVMPTALGNALRAAEDRAGRRYGLDTVSVWPRLYSVLGKRVLAIVDDERTQLDVAVRFCVVLLVAAVVSLGLLVTQGWLLLVPAATFVLAWLAYKGSVGAAVAYGEGLETAFDLHRFDLLRALHLPLPTDAEQERAQNAHLSAFLAQGTRAAFDYVHGEAADEGVPATVED